LDSRWCWRSIRSACTRRANFHLASRRLVCGCALHADKEVVLVFDQEYQNALIQLILFRCHCVVGVGKNAGLKNGGKVMRVHPVQVRLGGEDGEKVEDVEEQLSVERRQLRDEFLVFCDSCLFVEILDKLRAFSLTT
jgi:hypothetical protein